MDSIASDLPRERELGQSLLDLRRVFHRCRMLLPSASFSELLLLSGAVEQVATKKMRQHISKPAPTPHQPTKAALARVRKGRQAVASGKRPPIRDALLKVMGAKTLRSRDIFAELKKRGWLPNSKDPKQYVGYILSSQHDIFEKVKGKGRGVYRARSKKPATLQDKTKSAPRNTKRLHSTVLRFLASHGKPISTPELAKHLGIENGQALSPLMVSLHSHGALTKTEKDDVTLWKPVTSKLHEWDAERGGQAFNGSAD